MNQHREYQILMKKLNNNTITESERKKLMEIAFGKKFMQSDDKGSIKEY